MNILCSIGAHAYEKMETNIKEIIDGMIYYYNAEKCKRQGCGTIKKGEVSFTRKATKKEIAEFHKK